MRFVMVMALMGMGCVQGHYSPGGSGGSGFGGIGGLVGAGGFAGTGGTGGGDGGCRDGGPMPPRFGMVAVGAGSFLMGCNAGVDLECRADEYPGHTVQISAFAIDITEVTQRDWQACVDAGVCRIPSTPPLYDPVRSATLPVRQVTWFDARTYCQWQGKRLPTEAEWEKAARGADGRKYPWGNQPPDCLRVAIEACGCSAPPEPVGSHPPGAGAYGTLDMAGNVWEWVSDYYDANYYGRSPGIDPQGPPTGMARGLRGGGYLNDFSRMRVSLRSGVDPNGSYETWGFRCARSL